MITTRFAPSPTGPLHLGHAASAIRAHDLARAARGRFLVRIEDIDTARCRPGHVEGILADLAWLGLASDGLVLFQSQRRPFYDDALARLHAMDLLYPCLCTRAEIAASAQAPHGALPIYPGTCRGLVAPDLERAHGWRIDMARAAALAGPVAWTDHGRRIAADPLAQGDVVLARKDAGTSYHVAVVVDDAAQGVTDVVRGDDLFDATHVHRLLQALLGLPVPRWHHHPLTLDTNGQRLAKRDGAPTLAAMRVTGVDGRALADRLRATIAAPTSAS